MAKKGSFSKVYDKNGDYVDVEAARFDGTRTFQMQGDVSATQTWNGDSSSALTLNTSIGAKKVTTDKINDKAVQTGQIDDGAVGLTQIATNAMNGTVQDNDSKLATHAAVKTYVDSQISGQGTYLGKHTVAEINAMVTDNLHNGDRVMTSDSGTINLGPGGVGFDVEAGEDLILYKSGSTVQWDSMDGNFKTKQTAVSDPTASGTGLTFIDSASQDENGEMTLSKKTVQDGTTSQKGVVQLEDSHSSTSTTKAATPNSVKEAYDLANTANTGAVKNVAYDSTNKKITKTINGTTSDVVSAATLKTDMALNNVDNTSDANKPVSTAQQAALDLKLDKTGDGKDVTATFTEASTRANIGTGEKLSVIFGKIKKWFSDLGTAAFKNVPASGNASSTEVVLGSDTRLSAGASAVQDVTVDGASVVNSSTKVAAVPNASTSAKGAVQLAGSIGATVASENNKAATEKAVRDAINALDAEVTSNDGTNVQVKVTEADGKISAVNVTTDNTENKNNKVSSWQTTPDDTHYPSEKLVKDGLDAKADANKVVAIYDGYMRRMSETTGWRKLAYKTVTATNVNFNSTFRLYLIGSNNEHVGLGDLVVNIRLDGTGHVPECRTNELRFYKAFSVTCKIKVTATSDNAVIEIWFRPITFSMLMISCLGNGLDVTSQTKDWSFGQYLDATDTEPVADTANGVYVFDSTKKYVQYDIASPTNDNLVAMDASGLVKDSGLAKSSVESAISSAGSAIQGVKVNNTTLTPDANKVVTVPLATTSADGAMSAADKTKLDGIEAGAEANVQADWNQTDNTADDFIKNKPYYYKYNGSSVKYYKICVTDKLSSSTGSAYAIDFAGRFGDQSAYGRIIYRNICSLYMFSNKITSESSSNFPKFYYVENQYGRMEFYYKCPAYVSLTFSTTLHYQKTSVDFTNFGTEVSALPEGATEITPVWVANSASSSGTAPVKVDAYGALSAVTVDSTPDASHADNLISSKGVADALSSITSNVQADWDVTSASSDAFIKNKPQYKYYSTTSTYAKICSFPLDASGENVSGYGIDILYRRYLGEVHGRLLYKKNFKFYCEYTGDISYTNQSYSFYYVVNSNKMDVYAKRNGYTTLNVAPLANIPKDQVDFTGFGTEVSSLPEGATEITPVWVASSASSSGTAPVKVGSYGQLTAVGMDSTPTASSTNLMTSGDIKTALDGKVDNSDIAKMVQVATAGTAAGSNLNPVYVNASGVATAIDYQKWNSSRTDTLNALPSDWYKSEGSLSITSGNTVQYVELSGLNSIGGMDLWVMCNASNSPFMIGVRFNLFRYGRSGIQILDRSGYDNANINRIIIRTDSNDGVNPNYDNVKIYFRILNSSGVFAWRCSEARTNSHFAVLTEAQYNALTSVVACSANCTRVGATSTSNRHIQRGSYDVLDKGDVTSTYSSTGTDPVNGTAVASAISTKQDTLDWMTQQEAADLWTAAWNAAT